jgi:16S rRNA (guanine527-N7)-methyltransferase
LESFVLDGVTGSVQQDISSVASGLPYLEQDWSLGLSWQPNALQSQQFQSVYDYVVAGNQQLNLTRITEPQEFWEKHLWDSLRGIARWLGDEASDTVQQVIDIGTGGGFPGVPVAIAHPQWQVTLLDSTRKKVSFLDRLAQDLQLGNLKTLCDRAEQAGHHPKHRGHYDLALIRAVGSASTCAEYALPFLKIDGVAVLYRGQWTEAEQEGLQSAVQQLGGQIESVDAFTTPLSQGIRHCISLRKIQPTPASFPRTTGIPAKQPL